MNSRRKSNFVKFLVNLLLLLNEFPYLEPVSDSVKDFSPHRPDNFKISGPSVVKVSMQMYVTAAREV